MLEDACCEDTPFHHPWGGRPQAPRWALPSFAQQPSVHSADGVQTSPLTSAPPALQTRSAPPAVSSPPCSWAAQTQQGPNLTQHVPQVCPFSSVPIAVMAAPSSQFSQVRTPGALLITHLLPFAPACSPHPHSFSTLAAHHSQLPAWQAGRCRQAFELAVPSAKSTPPAPLLPEDISDISSGSPPSRISPLLGQVRFSLHSLLQLLQPHRSPPHSRLTS